MEKEIKIMGIVNVTPDSFYDGGRYLSQEAAVDHAKKLVNDGADIIDIGGESTRPGAKSVDAQTELERVCPVIEKLRHLNVPISIDTSKAPVAREAVKCGATIINDISGLTFDPAIAGVAAEYKTELIVMHIKGKPENMQESPKYHNILDEIYMFLENATERALGQGVTADRIIIDPGIGFGKSLDDNYVLINNIRYFKKMGYPVLIGLSRKSLIAKLYPDEGSDRLPATIALNTISVLNGANIIRVHDVLEHKLALESLKMLQKVS